MEPMEGPNSPDMFEDPFSSDDIPKRNSMDECSNITEDEPSVSSKEGKEVSSGLLTKLNFKSIPRPPKVAVQEKIIICLQNSQEEDVGYSFKDLGETTKQPSACVIRNEAIRMLIVDKLALAKDTEFSVLSVEPGKLEGPSPFTSNVNDLLKYVKDYRCVFNDERSTFDITPIFRDIISTVDIPEFNSASVILPSYILRVIFIYSSSLLIPVVNTDDPSYLKLMQSPCFIFDVFYLHEKASDFNRVEKIYQELGNMVSPSSYLLESSRDVTSVFNNIMKLLAHPNQRVNDSMWNF